MDTKEPKNDSETEIWKLQWANAFTSIVALKHEWRNKFKTRGWTVLFYWVGPFCKKDSTFLRICFSLSFFFLSCSVHLPYYLQHFGAGRCQRNGICSSFEFEPLIVHRTCNILVLFEAFWSWKLPGQRYLRHCWVRTSHFSWNLQRFGAQTVHGTG